MLTQSIILMVVAIWILVIPIALGFTLRGWWPKTEKEFGSSPIEPWIGGFLWPFVLVFLCSKLVVYTLWIIVAWVVRALFRFGGWLHHFFLD